MNAPAEAIEARPPEKKRRPKRDIDGWVLLDKPVGMTSTQAVGAVKWLFSAKKAGHAGTLDPLASGCLPIALGEATKTVPFVMDSRKVYRFTVRFGIETDTDDAEGQPVATSELRPSREAILDALDAFRGEIQQTPPAYSALKINGERAYDLAREGVVVELAPRTVIVHRLDLVEMPDADHAVFEAECGKGTYVRSIARDLGRVLGSRGHISALRRTCVGTFEEAAAGAARRAARHLRGQWRCRADGGAAPGRHRPGHAALAPREPGGRRAARPRAEHHIARARCADHRGLRRGDGERPAGGARRRGRRRDPSATHLPFRRGGVSSFSSRHAPSRPTACPG